jgi:2,3-bisphosphoglycerate-independent phosphoglycerate mutase
MSDTIQILIEMREGLEKYYIFLMGILNENEPGVKRVVDKLNELGETIDQVLKAECKHEYEEDWIDVTPDHSQKITYCRVCNCTF